MRIIALLVVLGSALIASSTAQDDAAHPRITNGPLVEAVTLDSGVVAWSTNVSAGSVVNYGTTREQLTIRAEMPWGGYTHRVTLRHLQPDTTYFFQASSPDAKGSGESLKSETGQFHTPPGKDGAAAMQPSSWWRETEP